ncbi:cbb3-type cytochrome c oxidase subunit 3 [Pseudoxanthomonas gei]|uniref:Cbb3-type cytochrome c oxidase subunit 3 n=1 Tax=Pseudoxanthomonas gei TaxID=1383030 RepID=A0ABX0A7D6_9GAMM|nr:cbb3-type cytochrome c oxidase subunit 3 [Pseudoxanthomonas gei]NDK37416.1 cbb3-type cytochrome c oxidase subunit 3 [Pseudoxanthomonas gei]
MLSGIITLALLVLFVGGWIWAWRPARKAGFDAAARLPLDDLEAAGDHEGQRP